MSQAQDKQSQIERFRQMARELGCDEDEAVFKEKLAQMARHKPKDVAVTASQETQTKPPRR